ncbi:hypothetical protein PP707_04555 [Acetobacter pasteurianus]|nr:hypothetical protein [Acetobacter pasteurianus]
MVMPMVVVVAKVERIRRRKKGKENVTSCMLHPTPSPLAKQVSTLRDCQNICRNVIETLLKHY